MAWGLACRSRGLLSKPTAGRSIPSRIPPGERSSALHCAPWPTRKSTMTSEMPIVHVIDDDEAARDSLAFLLGTAKIDVKTYESATAFLAIALNVKSGCIITDVRMPEITGIDLLRRLKELKIGVPVIVVTGHGDVPLAVEAMKIGAAEFLEKPFDDEVLLNAVRSALNKQNTDSRRQAERADIDSRLAALSNRE